MNTLDKATVTIARLLLATLFIPAGFNKIVGYAGTQAFMESAGVPGVLLPLVILLELGGGLALAAGMLTRLTAAALAFFSLSAALIFHADFSMAGEMNAFLKNLAIAGGLMLLVRASSLGWGVDEWYGQFRKARSQGA
ncbi:MAG: DoxX family protein [Salinisphaeraceae bacterium]|jgi:putative oxidoreductase|nr:DoxX family protein [Salinisphaeraceae bacterium]